MLFESIIICIILVFFIAFSIWLFLQIQYLYQWNEQLVELLQRTFKTYYKSELIEPVSVNWGIDLVWNPDNDEDSDKKGFITIWYGDGCNVDTPIRDVTDADVLGAKIIEVTEKHIQDRDLREYKVE